MAIVPVEAPLLEEPSRPSVVCPAVPFMRMICPAARTLSGVPAATLGQVKVSPSAVTVAPGVSPAFARPVAEKLNPPPSKFAADWLLSSEMPTLSKSSARLAAGAGTGACLTVMVVEPWVPASV